MRFLKLFESFSTENEIMKIVATPTNYGFYSSKTHKDYNDFINQIKTTVDQLMSIPKDNMDKRSLFDYLSKIDAFENDEIKGKVVDILIGDKSNDKRNNGQLTDAAISNYVNNSKLVTDIDNTICKNTKGKINNKIDIEGDVDRLNFLGIKTIEQLNNSLNSNKDNIIKFANIWIGADYNGSFDRGICLFYLEYVLVAQRNDEDFCKEYILKYITDNPYSSRYILSTYKAINK